MAVVSYVDRRDTINRLARVSIVGDAAIGWLPVLDPSWVRAVSDRELARFVGGSYGKPVYPQAGLYPWPGLYPNGQGGTPPIVPGDGGAWGSGAWGSGPWGG